MDGERLKKALEQNGLKQKDLVALLSVTPAAVSKWANGTRDPDDDMKNRIATALGVTTDYLMGRTEDPAPEDIKKEAPSQTAGSPKENHLDNLESNLESRPLKTVMIPVYAESEICCGKGFAYSSDCSTDVTPSRRIPFVLPPVGQGPTERL
jgi:transcriptional regulator with XRE-family HTH domain